MKRVQQFVNFFTFQIFVKDTIISISDSLKMTLALKAFSAFLNYSANISDIKQSYRMEMKRKEKSNKYHIQRIQLFLFQI